MAEEEKTEVSTETKTEQTGTEQEQVENKTETSTDGKAEQKTDVKTDTKTLVQDTDKSTTTVAPTFPDEWRQLMAENDTAALDLLKRYQSPKELVKKILEQDKFISSGGHKKPPAKDATPEQIAAYRKANGIPDSPEKYEAPEGIIIGEIDKPIVNEFLKTAHSGNLNSDQVKQSLKWYFGERDRQIAEAVEKDSEFKSTSDADLHKEWGGDYGLNRNLILGMVAETMPSGLFERLAAGRTSDGKKLGDTPEFIKWMAGVARKLNPDAVVMPNFDGNKAQAIDDEIGQLTKESGNRGKDSTYWHGPQAEQKQARLRELLGAKGAMARK